MKTYNNILEAIGNTPLIKLNNLSNSNSADIYVKYEGLNVGGSIKTRTAYNMILKAEKDHILTKDSIIVEATTGNQGIGLALIGAVKKYKVIIIMPDSVSHERRKLINQYGAEVILVHDDHNIGECVKKCKELALKMKKENPHVFLPLQFENIANVEAQEITGKEIIRDLGLVDGFVAGIGTGGTITGIGRILKEHNPNITIWAIEPDKAAILSKGSIGSHIQMGIGDGIIPPILDQSIYDDICVISDDEAITTAKLLASKEGILGGITSGTNVAAAIKLANKLGKHKKVVTILADTGERYYSTPLFD